MLDKEKDNKTLKKNCFVLIIFEKWKMKSNKKIRGERWKTKLQKTCVVASTL
jgi:hypothetical protein